MPSTWHRWGMDADGDGVSDPWNPEDAIFSAARYLAAAGGATDISRAIFAYNHAQWYVDEVLAGARLYDGGLDARSHSRPRNRASRSTTAAAAVADAESMLAEARPSSSGSPVTRRTLAAAPRGPSCFSDRLEAEREAGQAGFRRADAAAEVERLVASWPPRSDALEQARQGALTSSSHPSAGRTRAVVRGRLRLPGRRRPASRVRLAHASRLPGSRHRRPAGRSALRAHGRFRGRRLGRGRTATAASASRCKRRRPRLDVLPPVGSRPDRAAGHAARRGRFRRLRRLDGHSTGPHLHLQLQPASSYPQDEPWFQAFAGTSFSWQDQSDARWACGLRRARGARRDHVSPHRLLTNAPVLPTHRHGGPSLPVRAQVRRPDADRAARDRDTHVRGREPHDSRPRAPGRAHAGAPDVIVVPDVRRQVYVFAKGTLEEGGFAWKVTGSVAGYSANRVAAQSPAPGTRVLDTGPRPSRSRSASTTATRRRASPRTPRSSTAPPSGSPTPRPTRSSCRRRSPRSRPRPSARLRRRSRRRRRSRLRLPSQDSPEGEAQDQAAGQADVEEQAGARIRGSRRPPRAAGRAPAPEPRPPARRLALQPSPAQRRQRLALAVPARLDRRRRADGLVARRRGSRDLDPRRRARPGSLGHRRQERGRGSRHPRRSSRKGPMIQRLRRLLGCERGYTLIELLQVTVILGVILGAVTTLFVRASIAEVDMNRRFQAQQEARLAVDRMRREIHCASLVAPDRRLRVDHRDASVRLPDRGRRTVDDRLRHAARLGGPLAAAPRRGSRGRLRRGLQRLYLHRAIDLRASGSSTSSCR